MKVYAIHTSETEQRTLPADLQRLISGETLLVARLVHFNNTGRHTPSVSYENSREAWISVFSETGASQALIDMLTTSLELWRSLVQGYEATFARFARANLQVGDRFILHGDQHFLRSPFLYRQALNLGEEVSIILERAIFGQWVLTAASSHSNHTEIVEALVTYRPQIHAIISEPRLWRADGKINEKKAVKLLSDNVSASLDRITGTELETLALYWKGTADTAVARTPGASQKGKAFEDEVERLFLACGFVVETTASSGDYGVDLVLSNAGLRIAVQVKNLAAPVGVGAVQEVSAGALHYRCAHTLVVANNGFTDAARVLASSTGTRLQTLHSLREHLKFEMVRLLAQ